MNSLKLKFLGLTGLILVVSVIGTTWYNLRNQRTMLEKMAADQARLVAETVRNSIMTDMANGRNEQVGHTLAKISREPAIDGLQIFDETGRIMISDNPGSIGDLVPTAELLAFRTGNHAYADNNDNHEHFNIILPFENSPACHSCHGKEQEILGVLSLKLSLDDLATLQDHSRNATMVASGAMLLILVLSITAFLLIYVDAPIRKLVGAMEHAEQGDFQKARASVTSSDEMTLLSAKFNFMVQRLRELMETTVKHERELAITQEKLAHTEEVQALNATLEERLKEIEYLNINLEERIEEIEEANFKIADLASELEGKNFRLSQAVERLQSLYQMGLAINAIVNLTELFDLLSEKTIEALNAQVGYILIFNEKTSSLHVGGAAGLTEGYDRDIEVPLKPGGVSYWVFENNRPILIENVDKIADFTKMSRLGFLRESVVCAPLTDQGKVIGTITAANPVDGSKFTNSDLELLSTIAAQASIAIRNARLYEEQEKTYLNTVQALVSAIEASDAYTRGHSERVTRYSMALGRHVGLGDDALKRLERAAVLHDIGKIGIDISILHKREKLTPADIEVLKQHPSIGVRILEPIHFLGEVRDIIEQHHERYDGQGYPKGLSAAEWLIEAKILAICDTYDAMTSDRPYRKALPREIALQEIHDHAGRQFDPEMAAAFIGMCNDGQLPS
ncbi:MAG: HD domain-containing protein [Deltaproteobacteria bacterium]|nr:MAG: HD domain-containing protein [Deltaproteobacteria bacterium]